MTKIETIEKIYTEKMNAMQEVINEIEKMQEDIKCKLIAHTNINEATCGDYEYHIDKIDNEFTQMLTALDNWMENYQNDLDNYRDGEYDPDNFQC